MKRFLFLTTSFVVIAMLVTSCKEESKLGEAVGTLNAIPIFFGDQRVEHTVSLEEKTVVIDFKEDDSKYKNVELQVPDWAKKLIGYDWAPQIVFHRLLGGSTPTYMLATVLGTKTGGNPVNEFLDLMDKEQATFELHIGGKTFKLTPADVRKIMKEDEQKNVAAPAFAQHIARIYKSYNEKSYYTKAHLKDVTNENDTLYFNLVTENETGLYSPDEYLDALLFSNLTIAVHCFHNKLSIAYRLKDTDGNTYKVVSVPQERLAESWQYVQEKAARKDSIAAAKDSVSSE